MKIMITGGSGFIGSSLIPRLVKEFGHIYNIGRKNISKISSTGWQDYCEFTYDSLPSILNDMLPDLVINLATGYYKDDKVPDMNVIDGNLKIQFIILEHFKKKQTGRFINLGSYWEFSYSVRGVEGVNPYGIIKATLRKLLSYYSTYGVIHTNIMLYGSFGKGDGRGKILDNIIDSMRSGSVIELSPGEQKLNLVYIYDIINSIMLVVNNRASEFDNKIVAIYSDKEYTIKQLVDLLGSHKNRFLFGSIPYRQDEVMKPEYIYKNILEIKDNVVHYINENLQ